MRDNPAQVDWCDCYDCDNNNDGGCELDNIEISEGGHCSECSYEAVK